MRKKGAVITHRAHLLFTGRVQGVGFRYTAEKFAADLIDRWHEDLIPGELHEVLGLSPREYQAWSTGGVSLLTIAHWQQNSHPPLDVSRPWFKISGKPGRELVGYLDDKRAVKTAEKPGGKRAARRT